jgi:hypothetical protein
MTEGVRPTAQLTPISAAVARGAEASGAPFQLLMATAQRESSLNPQARAGTSSATGLFQFIDSTWLSMVQRHGTDHGLGAYAGQIETRDGRPYVRDPSVRQSILNLRFDPEVSARMAGELAQENGAFLERRLGREATPGELYAAHVMGPSGAARLIEAAEAGAPNAAALFPREAAANRGLFYTRDGTARSAEQLLARLNVEPGLPPAATSIPVGGIGQATVPESQEAPQNPPPATPWRAPGLVAPETTHALLSLVMDWPNAARILRDDADET